MSRITLSLIKADVGGYVGHHTVHPELVARAEEELEKARSAGRLIDFRVLHCGDDLELILTHREGTESEAIHRLAWETFLACTDVAKRLKLYGAGQDLLSDAFSGNIKGMGPGVAELSFEERPSEPIVIFMADKTAPGAWNLPVYKMFADAFNTIGLVIEPKMHRGFTFEVHDLKKGERVFLSCPEDLYKLLLLLGAPDRFAVKHVFRNHDGEIAAALSTQKLAHIAGRYVGKDDPAMVVRCQSGFPALGEVLEAFTFPHLVPGWSRGSHHGPLMPVRFGEANPSRFDGPPRVIAAGFQLAEGRLVGPRDLFDDPAFDLARRKANEVAEYMRRHGPFEPHRVPLDEMEYTTLPQVMEELRDRWEPIGEGAPTPVPSGKAVPDDVD